MTEALRTAPAERIDGITPEKPPRPNHAGIPLHLVKATERLGTERAKFTEKRVQNLIASQSDIVENVSRNELGSEEDTIGHDLTVILKGDSPVRVVYVQVKSSRSGVVDYKQWIRDKYFPYDDDNMTLVGKWMTKHGIILLNGSETKTDQDIIESFKPQLERIQQRASREQNTEDTGQMRLFPETSQIQIFP